MSKVLVTGGAGYIGSHTTRQLLDAGYKVVVLDNLYSGHRWAVDKRALFIEGDAGDAGAVSKVLQSNKVSAIIHFAGHIVVPESVEDPLKYYNNNCLVTQNLADLALKYKVEKFIFSSSAAVYGNPERIPARETDRTLPISPYGRTKLISEWMLADVAAVSEYFNYVALRYFNVAGAALDGSLGQATPEATHLIKIASELAAGKRDRMAVFGTDYDTSDGTCVRDYIHIEDLAAAHVSALKYLDEGGKSNIYNCGYGKGYSVKQVLSALQKLVGKPLNIVEEPRRAGDPDLLVANNSKILADLNWRPKYQDIELICKTALSWETSYNLK